MAMDAYSGGKFEITRRGSSQAYRYDISSAYPFEVSRLLDLSKAKVYHEARYIKDATYAWYTARIAIECSLYHSISVLFGSLRCYPEGYFTRSLTKSEMDYLVAHNVDVKVIDAYHLDVPRHRYPYKNVIAELYSSKQEFKGKDASQYQLYKLILNGFYGKLVQLIKLPNGKLRAGKLWHPLYSSIITANVRLRMSEIQQALGDSCLAVHTDSVFTLVPLSDKLIGDKLGYFQFEGYERLLLIACGIYEFGSKVAYRGLPMRKGFKWTELLETMGKHTHLTLSVPLIISWIEATHRNKLDLVNRFLEVEKEIDLNCDRKRIWLERATPNSLLTRLANSLPLFSSG